MDEIQGFAFFLSSYPRIMLSFSPFKKWPCIHNNHFLPRHIPKRLAARTLSKRKWRDPFLLCVVVCHIVHPSLLRFLEGLDEHLGELADAFYPPDFIDEQGHLDDVEVFAVEVVDLFEVPS